MEQQTLTPQQVIARFGPQIERLVHISDDKPGRPIAITAITVAKDQSQRETLALRLASAAYLVPVQKRFAEITSPGSNAYHSPLAAALRALPPIKFMLPHQG